MSIEELSKVAEMIKGLGDAASDGFIMWLWLQVFSEVWGTVAFLSFILIVAWCVKPFMRNLVTELSASIAMKKLRAELYAGRPGPLTTGEIETIIEKVEELNRKNT